jgi:hypothetical protein
MSPSYFLELHHLLDHVTMQHGRVVPLGVLQRGGDHVLRHRVELVRELALVMRPDGGEAVVGDATEQQCVGRPRLLPLELIAFGTSCEGVRPADPLEVLGSARRLHDAVDGDVLGHDDPAHLGSPLVVNLGLSAGP